jgi:hypothetical protein
MSPTHTKSAHPSPAPRSATSRVAAVGARDERVEKTGTSVIRYEARTTIDRPVADVFARLADLDDYGAWMHRTGMFRWFRQISDGPLGLATGYWMPRGWAPSAVK